jgi:hypothetical protein
MEISTHLSTNNLLALLPRLTISNTGFDAISIDAPLCDHYYSIITTGAISTGITQRSMVARAGETRSTISGKFFLFSPSVWAVASRPMRKITSSRMKDFIRLFGVTK